MKNTTAHKLYIDVLRTLAALGVIFVHTYKDGHLLFLEYNSESVSFYLYMCISIFSSCFVPVFFMISGALLLDRKESVRYVWKHRIARVALVLLVFSFINYILQIYLGTEDGFSLSYFFLRLYKNYWNYSYWFLYSYIAFLIFLPLIQAAVPGLNNSHFLYLIIIMICYTGVYPLLRWYYLADRYNLSPYFNIWWACENIVIYPLTGYYIDSRIRISNKRLPFLWISSCLCLAVCSLTTVSKYTLLKSAEYSTEYWDCFAIVYAAALFLTIRNILSSISVPATLTKLITITGRDSFGVYLFHVMVMDILQNTGILDFFRKTLHINYMLSAWIYAAVIFCISLALTEIFRKLPYIGRML